MEPCEEGFRGALRLRRNALRGSSGTYIALQLERPVLTLRQNTTE